MKWLASVCSLMVAMSATAQTVKKLPPLYAPLNERQAMPLNKVDKKTSHVSFRFPGYVVTVYPDGRRVVRPNNGIRLENPRVSQRWIEQYEKSKNGKSQTLGGVLFKRPLWPLKYENGFATEGAARFEHGCIFFTKKYAVVLDWTAVKEWEAKGGIKNGLPTKDNFRVWTLLPAKPAVPPAGPEPRPARPSTTQSPSTPLATAGLLFYTGTNQVFLVCFCS